MHPHRPITVLLVSLIIAVTGIDTVSAEQPAIQCGGPTIHATFKAAFSIYHVTTNCNSPAAGFVNWDSRGSYDSHTGMAREDVQVSVVNGFAATATTTLICPSDPWLAPPFGAGKVACSHGTFNVSGQVSEAAFWLDWLRDGFSGSALPNSTGFHYNRPILIGQRDADLQAEADAAAALEHQNRRLRQAIKPGVPAVAPTIVLPAVNALFLENTTVPIKLLPPPGMQVMSFMVKLERRDGQGNWVVVTHFPISIAEATSPTDYTGWGAPGNGKGPTMMAGRGTYRISAQVGSPRQTRWSAPVQFVVTTPTKAIQKGPKLFDQGGGLR